MTLSNYRVLVVDDEESIRDLISHLLSKKGHQCTTAMDGVEALDKVHQNGVDAVITDIVMPKMDGITLTKELSKEYPGLPIMVMTGYTEEYSVEGAIAAGAKEFIKKPCEMAEFMVRFNKMMWDREILCQIEAEKNEMVFQLQKEYLETVQKLEKEIENFKHKLTSIYMDF
jgi:CheY-like chemotaxis protein